MDITGRLELLSGYSTNIRLRPGTLVQQGNPHSPPGAWTTERTIKMRTTLICAPLAALMVVILFSGFSPRTRWTDDEARAWLANKWADHCKRYGAFSNSTIFAYSIETNWSVCIMANGEKVELGFRDDGVVVWRTKR